MQPPQETAQGRDLVFVRQRNKCMVWHLARSWQSPDAICEGFYALVSALPASLPSLGRSYRLSPVLSRGDSSRQRSS